ncbi:hypothetical protein QGP82_14300 [Leptothoe sp. LEGE 181152]|nr:hypothetical protein [Leptothoe sp. LEGE 181152]
MRVATFALSLFLLVQLRGGRFKYPATRPAFVIIFILLCSILHPQTNTLLSWAAQIAMYVAILGPIFWVRHTNVTTSGFRLLILIMWLFHSISALFGVLQVYYPGKFQPFLSTASQSNPFLEGLQITLANGQTVYRPMGLTDQPGGAALAGFYAIIFGVGIALNSRNRLLQGFCALSSAIGLFVITLTQVRSVLMFVIICLLSLALVLLVQKKIGRLAALSGGIVSISIAVMGWAVAVGGQSTIDRFSALLADRADAVYYEHRGYFLEETLNHHLPQYPLGAGLGRWGMMHSYFGHDSFHSPSLWVEIQWTAWLFDGGVLLIIAYVAALLIAFHIAWKIAMSREMGDLQFWGMLIFAYDVGSLAITFNYPLFISQTGMEFWLLNAALYTAACTSWRQNVQNKLLYPLEPT